MRFVRSLTGVTLRDHIRSEDLRRREIQEMVSEIQEYQHKWKNHVLRMSEVRLPRKLQYKT